jgi:cephalosporin hydroxylase
LWIYQEILWEVKPALIIECGTAAGGSTLFLAQMCDLIGKGQVVSIDIVTQPGVPEHPRITYLTGNTLEDGITAKVRVMAKGIAPVLAILDSDHRMSHVLQEMRIYGELVTFGSYLIIEDTNINGHPVLPGSGPGPMEAVEQFLRENHGFLVDESREKFMLTQNPQGYLRKK